MNFGSGAAGGGAGNVVAEKPLEQIETEQIYFHARSGEDRLRLLPSAWPLNHLPLTTSSLLSIASTKDLIAAAGPECLVVASTESLRQSFAAGDAAPSNVRSFTPQATLPIPRVSQVAFSSDESCLVVAAEQGGGLAVYDTNALMNGGQQPAFQLATEGQSVRQLLPNPNPAQDLSKYFGIVTENGQLLLADLKQQKLVTGSKGSVVFHEQVTCACWSRLGKQLVAGLANGTAVQVDQQGVVKAEIPEPPQLASWKEPSATAHPVTSIFWLETFDFLIIHTPVNPPGEGGADDSAYHLAHRDKATSTWTFRKFNDPCVAFGMDRKPAHHFVQRIRDWLDVSDLLILASTASPDIGMFTRSKSPLDPQTSVTDTFTSTQSPDNRRAAMPMAADGSDTSPIGMALDLSGKDKLAPPGSGNEMSEQDPVPLPVLYVLDNEGLLSIWYVVLNESLTQSRPYPDLVAAGGPRPLGDQKAQQAAGSTTSAAPSLIANSSTTSPFGQPQHQPAVSTFGSTGVSTPAFGQPSTPAFGGSSSLGMRQSPWTSGAAQGSGGSGFSQPAFGSSTFGQAGGASLHKNSIWGSPQQQQQSQQPPSTTGVFGGSAAQASPFMSLGNQSSRESGFAGVSKDAQSPFATAGKQSQPPASFGSGPAAVGTENGLSSFASVGSKPGLSAQTSGSTVSFGNGSSFASGSTAFGVTSFQSSPTPTPQQTQSREESMADDEDQTSETSALKVQPQASSTNDTSGGGLFGLGSSGFKLGSTFKPDGTATGDLPKPKDAGAGLFGRSFGESLGLGASSAQDGSRTGNEATWMGGRNTPPIKKEPGTEEPKLNDIPATEPHKADETPLSVDDAPLPPDPTTWKPKPGALPAPVPPGFGTDVFGSGKTPDENPEEDAAAPTEAATATPKDLSKDAGKTLAGSPPVDLGAENFSERLPSSTGSEEAAGPPESEDEEGQWSDEERDDDDEDADDDEEGEEEEEEEEEDQDEDQENITPKVIDAEGLSAFEARLTPASPKRAEQQKTSHQSVSPATDKKDSYTPAGLPKAPIIFSPPQRSQESPRSPSPQRSATSPVRSMPPSFSSSQLGAGSKGLSLPQPMAQHALSKPSQLPPPSQPRTSSLLAGDTGTVRMSSRSGLASSQIQQNPPRIAVPSSQLVKPELAPATKSAEPEEGELEDDEDARIQAVLAAPIEATKDVPEFLAHQDYVADGREKDGLGGQIERVFRDINSMIDTLALNARSLRGFVEGNSDSHTGAERGRLDLEEEEDWTLCEAGHLDGIMQGIDVQLEDGRIEDASVEIEALQEDEKEIGRLRTKTAEARKKIAERSNPDQLAQQHSAPLPMDSQAQQSELRLGVQTVQRLLTKVEGQLSVLRAELASSSKASNGDRKSSVPSVEAVTNTILKMTAMIEKKSGDVDVLESQIKRLGGPAALGLMSNYEDDLVAGMKASRLSHATSPAVLRGSRASVYGSPAAASRMRASRNSPGTPGTKKSLFDVSDAEVEAYTGKKEGRKKAMERLREQLEARGPRVVQVGQ